jgi:hypothetical protein
VIRIYNKQVKYTSPVGTTIKETTEPEGMMVINCNELRAMANKYTCTNCGKTLNDVMYINSHDLVFCSAACVQKYD